jgi:epsilon-lactone hydrolase
MASKQSDQFITFFQGLLAPVHSNPEMPLDEVRAVFEHMGDITTEPGGVDYLETRAAGLPALWCVPKNCATDRVLLCSHGGGYVVGSMFTHRKLYAHLAKAIGCKALIVHYRLAPESPHPGPVNDMASVYRWLLDQGIKSDHIALTGDSAGGGLAVTTLLCLRQQGQPLPAASMPLSPWIDMDGNSSTFQTNKDNDILVAPEMLGQMATTFLGENGSRQDPLVNPLHGDLRGLPPIYIQVGGYETLLDDSRSLADALRKVDGEVKLDEFPQMQHVFQFMAGVAPEADDAIRRLASWVRPKLGLSS